jgi:hypothetical protein
MNPQHPYSDCKAVGVAACGLKNFPYKISKKYYKTSLKIVQ